MLVQSRKDAMGAVGTLMAALRRGGLACNQPGRGKVEDLGVPALTMVVDAVVALLHAVGVPGDLIVNQAVAVALQVDSLTTSLSRLAQYTRLGSV